MAYQDRAFVLSYAFRRILVAYDGSSSSERGLRAAIELSRLLGSEVTVVYACQKGKCEEKILENARKISEERGVKIYTKLLVYDPEESSASTEIIKEINSLNYELVVMGVRGKSVSEKVQKGSTSMGVFANTNVSYLFVK